jgi:hypothetical protein
MSHVLIVVLKVIMLRVVILNVIVHNVVVRLCLPNVSRSSGFRPKVIAPKRHVATREDQFTNPKLRLISTETPNCFAVKFQQ